MKVIKLLGVIALSGIIGSFSVPLLLGMGFWASLGTSITVTAGSVLILGTISAFIG